MAASIKFLLPVRSQIFTKLNILTFKNNTHLVLIYNPLRYFSTTVNKQVKEIVRRVENDIMVIEGVPKPSAREGKVIDVPNPTGACTICRLNLEIKYTDVLILCQFVALDGSVLPRKITGVCRRQQLKLEELIDQVQKSGLLPSCLAKDPKQFWKKFNAYF